MDEDTVSNQPAQSSSTRPSLAHNPSSNSGRPKGILKNAHPTGEGSTVNEGVRWDEVNLNLNEVEKEATTRMQILEPKTPYVRYNAETDEVMDLDKIPGFELGLAEQREDANSTANFNEQAENHHHQHDSQMNEGGTSSAASDSFASASATRPTAAATTSSSSASNRTPSSRSSSFSGSRRGSESTSRRGSDVSERKMVVVEDLGPGADAEDEGADEETRQAKKIFKERRGSHYSGEGEVMKRFKAGLINDDDEDEDDDEDKVDKDEFAIDVDGDEDEEDDEEETGDCSRGTNGTHSTTTPVNGSSTRRTTRNIPPVPPIPNGLS